MSSLKKFSKKCYTSQHLHPQEYGVWEVCMRLTSGGKNKLYFDGRTMAARFAGIKKDTMYRIVKALVASGWLLPLNGAGRKVDKSTRQYKATEYRVISHDQWTAKHGEKHCASDDESPVSDSRMEDKSPVSNPRMASLESENGQSENAQSPVSNLRHSFVVNLSSMKESSMRDSFVCAAPPACLEGTQEAGGKCASTPSVPPVSNLRMDVQCAHADDLSKKFAAYCSKVKNDPTS